MRMLTKLLFGESGKHTGERCQLLLTPCYFVPALTLHDMVNFKNMVFMYGVYNKLLPANIMSYLKTINACHNHNVRVKNCSFKIKLVELLKNLNVLV